MTPVTMVILIKILKMQSCKDAWKRINDDYQLNDWFRTDIFSVLTELDPRNWLSGDSDSDSNSWKLFRGCLWSE